MVQRRNGAGARGGGMSIGAERINSAKKAKPQRRETYDMRSWDVPEDLLEAIHSGMPLEELLEEFGSD